MICKIFYRKVTGDVEKMRISKKEEKKCKIVETEKTKEINGGKKWLRGKSGSKILQNSRSECNNCIECDPWKNGKSIKKDEKKDRGDSG